MSQIIVSAQELETKKENLTTLHSTLGTQIQTVETLGKNLNSMWEGDAKEKYMMSLSLDLAQMKILLKAIAEFISVLTKIIALYNLIEKKNAATAAG